MLEAIKQVDKRTVLLVKLLSPHFERLDTVHIDRSDGRCTNDSHISFLGQTLVQNIEKTEEELVAVVGHFNTEMLEAGVINTLGKLQPQISWTDILTTLTLLQKLNDICKRGR